MNKARLRIEIPPGAFKRPRFASGRAYKDPKYRKYSKVLSDALWLQWRRPPLDCPVMLDCLFVTKRPKNLMSNPERRALHTAPPDLDNFLKAVLDSGNGVVWKDDRLIVGFSAVKLRAAAGEEPHIVLEVIWDA